jgi:ABC-type uncharacterized transport system fused permease/ATPase subunit
MSCNGASELGADITLQLNQIVEQQRRIAWTGFAVVTLFVVIILAIGISLIISGQRNSKTTTAAVSSLGHIHPTTPIAPLISNLG